MAGNVSLTPKELAAAVARTNAWQQAEDLFNNNEAVRTAVEAERLLLTAAFYDLTTGRFEWMGQYRRRN